VLLQQTFLREDICRIRTNNGTSHAILEINAVGWRNLSEWKRLHLYIQLDGGEMFLKTAQALFSWLLRLFAVLYLLLYMGYNWIIEQLHASYSVISISAILLPFLVFLFFPWVSGKLADDQPENQQKRNRKRIVLTLLGSIPPVYSAVLLGINEYESHFTVERWLTNERERVYMVDDLLREYPLTGMTKDEVTALLGPPTETNYFQADDNLVYYLGDERGLISIDSEWLVIRLDGGGNVIEYQVLTD